MKMTAQRLIWLSALTVAWAVTGEAVSQERLPPAGSGEARYETPVALSVSGSNPVLQADYVPAPPSGDPALESRVAELEAALKKMRDKEAADKAKAASAPTVKPFGKIHWDTATFSQNTAGITQAGNMLNGTQFRRARIGLQGEAFQVMDYRIEMDFAGTASGLAGTSTSPTATTFEQVAFKDVYVTVKELPWVGNIRIGHFKECFSMEILDADDCTEFMERSMISSGGVLGHLGDRNPGVMAFDWNEAQTVTWQYGVFDSQPAESPPTFPKGTFFDDKGGAAVDVRATWLPWVVDVGDYKNRGLFHTGIAYSYRNIAELVPTAPKDAVRYQLSALPEINLGNAILNTGSLNDTDHVNAVRPELAMVYGPLSIESEYMWFWLDRTQHANPTFDGGYVSVSYILTGENRNYDRQRGFFRGVVPFENFFRVRDEDGYARTGIGAWEIAYRVSYLNLNDEDVHGGRAVDHTVGLNWYMNPAARMMFNLVYSETTDRGDLKHPGVLYPKGTALIFATRVQMAF